MSIFFTREKLSLKNVLTSGEAALNSLKQKKFGEKFYHLGPKRDDSLFSHMKKDKTTIEKCDFILCTGLFDEEEEKLKYYENLLKNFIKEIKHFYFKFEKIEKMKKMSLERRKSLQLTFL